MFEVSIGMDAKQLREIKKRLRDCERPLVTFTREKVKEVEKQFSSMVDPDGKPWKPLKASTVRSKRQNKDKILTHTGKMSKSIRRKTSKLSFEIKVDTDYAIYHQLGTKKMAKREILKITESDKVRIKNLILVFIGLKQRA